MISAELGAQLWQQLILHDDGVDGSPIRSMVSAPKGGKTGQIYGEMGSGKTTLLQQIAEQVRHYDLESKNIKNEMVIYRGLQYDNWNCLLPDYASAWWGHPKSFSLHVHQDDDLFFFTQKHSVKTPLGVEPIPYSDNADLFSHLIDGINVVYEPQQYTLSPVLVKRLKAKKLQKVSVSDDYDEEEGYVATPPPVWWFEFLEYFLEYKGDQFCTVILDEADEVFPANSSGDLWHLIDWFKNEVRHMRKNNASLIVAGHDYNLLDYRITGRMQYSVWLPGSIPNKKSSVWKTSVRHLNLGEGIIERSDFGRFTFPRITSQPPIVRVAGMSALA